MPSVFRGHLAALFTIFVWAMTFISIKIVLRSFSAMDVTFIRLFIAYFSLCVFSLFEKKPSSGSPSGSGSPFSCAGLKKEGVFMLAGFFGIAAYFLLQNIGMEYTTATNTSIILNAVPVLTALLAWIILKDRSGIHPLFFLGFVLAMAGIVIISLNGEAGSVHLKGDLIIFLAAVTWGCYTLVTPRVNASGHSLLWSTRRMHFWGLVWMFPFMIIFRFRPDMRLLLQPVNLLHFLFLGVIASALCFVTWNYTVRELGSIKASAYIYGQPIIAVIASALILHETITPRLLLGIILSFLGVLLSGLPARPR